MKKDIKSLNLEQLTEELLAIGEKKFRAKQVYSWIHQKLADSFDEMTNLSKDLRERLDREYTLRSMDVVAVQTSKIDGTQKYLFQLYDGHVIESVLMKYHHGFSSKEIARLMRITEANAIKLDQRAKNKLYQLSKEEGVL